MATLSQSATSVSYIQHLPVGIVTSHSNGGDVALSEQTIVQENPPEQNTADPENVVDEQNAAPVIDIVINNVVCSFSVGCHLNLRQIALEASNVEFRRESGMLSMKLRSPYTTASIWSSGRITCTGATSEDQSKQAARRYSRVLQKLGFKIRLKNFRVVNVLGTCTMPFAIKLVPFTQANKGIAEYEPELHPGVTYKIKSIKATLKVFSTGSITITAPSVQAVQEAVEHVYPIVYEHRKERTCPEDMPRSDMFKLARRKMMLAKKKNAMKLKKVGSSSSSQHQQQRNRAALPRYRNGFLVHDDDDEEGDVNDDDDEFDTEDDDEEENMLYPDSDESWD